MLPLSLDANPALVAHLNALTGAERTYFLSLLSDDAILMRRVQRARDYHDGAQFVKLTDRLREFLGNPADLSDAEMLSLNVCHTVVNSVTEKLLVRGFSTDEPGDADKPVATWSMDVWQHNRMDVRQDDLHEAVIRDGSAFLIVDWPDGAQYPRFTTHPRYVGAGAGGDGIGCKIVYANNDPDQEALYAVKRWTETYSERGIQRTRERMTVYYPDQIERWYRPYQSVLDGWEPYTASADEDATIPWVDVQGAPLGIAVIPFRNHGDDQEARKALPMQNAINKLLVDLMASGDMTAFRILAAFGWTPTDSDGNPLIIEPGRWVGSPSKDGRLEAVDGADLDNFLNTLDWAILKVAQVTDTPASRFVTTKQVAAEGTLKQQEAPLVNKLRKRQARLGNGYEDAMMLGLRLHNRFGIGLPELPIDVTFTTLWEPAETRDAKEEMEVAKFKKEVLEIPVDVLQSEAGYEQSLIEEWKAAKEQRRVAMAAQLAPVAPTNPQDGQGVPQSGAAQGMA
jgi:hypothetical protein